MPLAAMEGSVIREKLSKMQPDLRFVLRDSGVSDLVQAHLSEAACDIATFGNIVDQKGQLRKFMLDYFQFGTPEDGLAGVNQVAAIMAAWESAATYKDTKDKSEAEDRLLGRPKRRKLATFLQIKKKFVGLHGEIDQAYVPARGLVELIGYQLEEGDFTALALDEVPSYEEAGPEDETLTSMFGRDMVIKFKKNQKMRNPAPSDPESLRKRLRILGHANMFTSIKHPNHEVFEDLSKDIWSDYSDWPGSSKVFGMEVRSDRGEKVKSPSWPLVLNYDFQIRKKMASLMVTENMPIGRALKTAQTDQDIRNEHFQNVFAASCNERSSDKRSRSRSRSRPSRTQKAKKEITRERSPSPDHKKKKAKAKSDGGWKGAKGGDKDNDKPEVTGRLHVKTPDHKMMCFSFNNKGQGCKSSSCDKVHVCQICLGKERTKDDPHPLFRCPLYSAYKAGGGKR